MPFLFLTSLDNSNAALMLVIDFPFRSFRPLAPSERKKNHALPRLVAAVLLGVTLSLDCTWRGLFW
jgi:hypothetical protein